MATQLKYQINGQLAITTQFSGNISRLLKKPHSVVKTIYIGANSGSGDNPGSGGDKPGEGEVDDPLG